MAVPMMRYGVRKLLSVWGLWLRPTVLVGYGPNAHEALAALHSEPEMGFKVVGFVDVAPAGKALTDVQGVPLLSLDEVKAWSQVPGVQVASARGGMYAFFRIEGFDDSMAVAKRLVAEAGIGLAPGDAFGPEGRGWLRWCFASKDVNRLAEGVRRLQQWLESNRAA